MGKTDIEWADVVWNIVAGCKEAGPECAGCYAARMTFRLAAMGQKPYQGLTTPKGKWNGKINLIPEKLDYPLTLRKPQRIFVNSMSDLFHEKVPVSFIARVFNTMASWALVCRKKGCPHDDETCWHDPGHTYIILTKRAERMYRVMTDELPQHVADCWPGDSPISRAMEAGNWPLPNVQLGVSVGTQEAVDQGVPWLLKTPAAMRCLSVEPHIKAVDLGSYFNSFQPAPGSTPAGPKIHQVYHGGESGPDARAMHVDWARAVRDQCVAAGTSYMLKQWGEWIHESQVTFDLPIMPRVWIWPDGSRSYWVGKAKAGRLLDGQEWLQYAEPPNERRS